MGAPRKWTPDILDRASDILRHGGTINDVASALGISPKNARTIANNHALWNSKNDENFWEDAAVSTDNLLARLRIYHPAGDPYAHNP